MMPMRSFLVALAFLSVVPIRFRQLPSDADVARSRFWFPVVGALLALLLGGWTAMAAWLRTPFLGAFLILLIWVGITAALHLDGLADACDGLFGGATPEDRLQIMKDPHIGTFGTVGVVLLLLGKFAALVQLIGGIPTQAPWLVGAAVWLARCHVVVVASLGRYPRPQGTGKVLIESTQRWEGWIQLLLTVAIVGMLVYFLFQQSAWFLVTVWLWLPSGILVLLLNRLFSSRLGGTTGDCLGAGIELLELTFLIASALLTAPVF
jgi:adenosylcobinamide-GDP ribazoletransferase